MLQLRTAGYLALDRLRANGEYPPGHEGIEDLEAVTDRFMARFFEERARASDELGPGFQLYELLDLALRSRELEHMDEPSTDGQERLRLLKALDRMNEMTFAYRHQIDILDPVIREIRNRGKQRIRLLELASGAGGLAFALARHAGRQGIALDVTASDIVPETVEEGNRTAAMQGLPVRFIQMNAFDFSGIGDETFDLVVVSQSLHHFTPGQLALMIARSQEHGATDFVGIDGRRSSTLLAGVPLVASLQGIEAFTGDGLTSARKFYSELELEIVAGIAAEKGDCRVTSSWPMTVMHVRFATDLQE
jgi:SAM-dependent methyltransferase